MEVCGNTYDIVTCLINIRDVPNVMATLCITEWKRNGKYFRVLLFTNFLLLKLLFACFLPFPIASTSPPTNKEVAPAHLSDASVWQSVNTDIAG